MDSYIKVACSFVCLKGWVMICASVFFNGDIQAEVNIIDLQVNRVEYARPFEANTLPVIDFFSSLPANEWFYARLYDGNGKVVRILESKPLSDGLAVSLKGFVDDYSVSKISWIPSPMNISRTNYVVNSTEQTLYDQDERLAGRDYFKIDMDPFASKVVHEFKETETFKRVLAKVNQLLMEYVPSGKVPELPLRLTVAGPFPCVSYKRLHTDGEEYNIKLAHAFAATIAPTVVFPSIVVESPALVDDQKEVCKCKEEESKANCNYCALIANGYSFKADSLCWLIGSGTPFHAGQAPKSEAETRVMVGVEVWLSQDVLQTLGGEGKLSEFLAEYWKEYKPVSVSE